ncbi:ImmA/IrrE family metallo-endopeptidase [Corynebacterium provencense]|uniref:ImmA/IrrE family metallo-endopeptidase n=1 Tax=Corynebacterium provencense TaxID=1737425 RepID=UPI000835A38E|nr:ImmA/IrrE family metallo-endopeptidase [Corynebacterium provencense]
MTSTNATGFTTLAVIADFLGVTLTHHDDGPPGYYTHHRRTISTRRNLSVGMYRSVLAHELGHAAYQDTTTTPGIFTLKQERRADRFALRLLFTDEEFAEAYTWCGPCIPALADELECSQHHIRLYMTLKKDTP